MKKVIALKATMAPTMTTSPCARFLVVRREVDQAQDTVHHGVAQRDQRINAAQYQAVDDLLRKNIHRPEIQLKVGVLEKSIVQ